MDCPTCGRSIRVPGLDGIAAPLPGPELDREDAHLARALDELAALVHAPVQRSAIEVAGELDDDVEIPQPLPEPEPVELPMPVRLTPVATIDPIGQATAENAAESRAALEELLQPLTSAAIAESSPRVVERAPSTTSLLFVAIIPCVTLLLGLTLGWWSRGMSAPSAPEIPAEILPAANVAPVPTAGIEGRITYRTAAGETKPDAGALVLVVPETWTGQLRLSPIGLRPGDGDADQAAALMMAKALGGGAVRTDDAGRYHLDLTQPGRYQVLVMSRFAERLESTTVTTVDVDRLQAFLADPAATVGQRAVQIETVTITPNAPTAWDHAF